MAFVAAADAQYHHVENTEATTAGRPVYRSVQSRPRQSRLIENVSKTSRHMRPGHIQSLNNSRRAVIGVHYTMGFA